MDYKYDSIDIQAEAETERIISQVKGVVQNKLKKKGAIVGISGGVDSSVVLGLMAKAFGPERVIGIMMPERDSSPDSLYLAEKVAARFGVKTIIEDLTNTLCGFECYTRRDEAVKRIFPEFTEDYKMKITLPDTSEEKKTLNLFYITIISPAGIAKTKRLPINEYLQIVAASNFKQRSRMAMLYYHAEKNNYVVAGTGNKNEHQQGFFVKYGDGGADIKPIAHLFKTQVYQIAEYIGVPEEVTQRTPTTDTYTAEQTQQEFFFQMPFDILDRVWFAMEKNIPDNVIASVLNISEDYVRVIKSNIVSKVTGTEYLRLQPVELDSEISV